MNKRNTSVRKTNIFISWSGEYSKRIAEELKQALEEDVFKGGDISCFVSTQDIASGEDWYRKIRTELQASKLGIMCITKENVKAPWLYFEAGALVGNDLKVIPLLVNCDQSALDHSPIRANQSVQFYDADRFQKMLEDIRKEFSLLQDLNKEEVIKRYEKAYESMKENLKPILDELKGKRYFSERYIYPQDITTMTMGTIYISAPMSTLSPKEYQEQQEFLKELSNNLRNKEDIKEVYCPAIEIEQDSWEGITTAVKENYARLRQVQHLIVIYPKTIATSALVEVGYGIALCKNIVIFYKEKLPFMLDGAAEDIPHLHTREYKEFSDITKAINTDRSLFEVKRDE